MDYETQAKYAIREVSLITGVKPVTLRAWQRRYNLLQPQRTATGHRLFSEHDIKAIQQIQGWLSKGVPIGKVAALLVGEPGDDTSETTSGKALQECEQLLCALADLNRGKAELIISITLREYPLAIVENQFISPVINALEKIRMSQKSLQKGLFQSIVLTRLAFMIDAENKASSKGKLLCVNLDLVGSLYAWLRAAVLAEQGYHVTLLDGVDDVSGFVDHQGLTHYSAIDFFSNKSLTESQLVVLKKLMNIHPAVSFSGVIPQLHQKEFVR